MDWIRYFDFYIISRIIGIYRLLILDGYESYYSEEFETYYQEYNIITLCIPPYFLYLL